jgi:hypothetical protein
VTKSGAMKLCAAMIFFTTLPEGSIVSVSGSWNVPKRLLRVSRRSKPTLKRAPLHNAFHTRLPSKQRVENLATARCAQTAQITSGRRIHSGDELQGWNLPV